jgi:hypothetical protein
MDLGFTWDVRKDGSVQVRRGGAAVTVVRGGRAAALVAELDAGDPQQVLARWTGSYRRGNERTAKNHERNRR